MAENNKVQILRRSTRSSQRAKVPSATGDDDLINGTETTSPNTVSVPMTNYICQDEPLNKHVMATDDVDADYYSNSTFDEDERFGQQLSSTPSSTSAVADKEEMNFETRLLSRNSSAATSSSEEKSNWIGRRYSLVQALSNPLTRLLDEPYEFNGPGQKKFYSTTLPQSHLSLDPPKRLAVLKEIVNCEKDYVGLLVTLVEEFLRPARLRHDLFDSKLISSIFCNVEKLKRVHQSFLADLDMSLTWKPVCIGPSFLKHVHAFEIYSNYCNNHQRSCQRLIQLYNNESHSQFFENCRIAGRLPPLRLDGFLLRPVQHLCRYPLLLAELLRLTPRLHPDYSHCSAALQCMQQLLSSINSKRRMLEEMVELVRWQRSIFGWHGPDILCTSCRLLHSGELSCSCLTKAGFQRWNKRSVVFLFDHLLIICRKDRLKKHLLFKTRIALDDAILEHIDSESWELSLPGENKRFVFKANNRQTFMSWMDAFNHERVFRVSNLDEPGECERQLAIDLAEVD